MSFSQWSRRLQQGALASVLSTLSLGLAFTGNAQAQSLSLGEECDYLATTTNQNLIALTAFDSQLEQFAQSASQATTLDDLEIVVNQYNDIVGRLIGDINGFSAELGGLSLTDPVIEGYRDDYITVLAGFVSALDLTRAAIAVLGTTTTAADLSASIESASAQLDIAVAQIDDLTRQEAELIDAVNQYCGLTTTVVPPSPVVPFPSSPTTQPSSNPGSSNGDSSPATPPRIEGYDYTEAMLMGYTAAEVRDWHTALINFRRALAARPGDRYALAAIANMEAYIADERLIAARRQRAIDLQATLAEAVAIGDWACAAASVDELITLVPPNSLDRARLVTYRGEVTGFIEARDRVENWSTVCPG
ncbi:MAG: hypothetical protein O2890_02720 [Cyanobacteria bacterium]|nr:hypothetical protein [Cyanobacteriota bacterium]MDA0865328.1 hypothetical protein [Cyanobacteriota bacterium]